MTRAYFSNGVDDSLTEPTARNRESRRFADTKDTGHDGDSGFGAFR